MSAGDLLRPGWRESRRSVNGVELHAVEAERIEDPARIKAVTPDVAKGAYGVLGGGSYGPKDEVRIKEPADHNLRYLVVAALIDRRKESGKFAPEGIVRDDVQTLLAKVSVSRPFQDHA